MIGLASLMHQVGLRPDPSNPFLDGSGFFVDWRSAIL
jgi:hypothetical protein